MELGRVTTTPLGIDRDLSSNNDKAIRQTKAYLVSGALGIGGMIVMLALSISLSYML